MHVEGNYWKVYFNYYISFKREEIFSFKIVQNILNRPLKCRYYRYQEDA